jgi:hypothetical protein
VPRRLFPTHVQFSIGSEYQLSMSFLHYLGEAQNKKLIQRTETIWDFADADGDTTSQYHSWETDYVERKENVF